MNKPDITLNFYQHFQKNPLAKIVFYSIFFFVYLVSEFPVLAEMLKGRHAALEGAEDARVEGVLFVLVAEQVEVGAERLLALAARELVVEAAHVHLAILDGVEKACEGKRTRQNEMWACRIGSSSCNLKYPRGLELACKMMR